MFHISMTNYRKSPSWVKLDEACYGFIYFFVWEIYIGANRYFAFHWVLLSVGPEETEHIAAFG